jgi:hypothetical protein
MARGFSSPDGTVSIEYQPHVYKGRKKGVSLKRIACRGGRAFFAYLLS